MTISSEASPYSLLSGLPAFYREDEFLVRFVSGLDEVLSPVLTDIDNLDSYLDPQVAPDGWVDWLAGWLALATDETWTPDRRRRMLCAAGEVVMWRGTLRGVRAALTAYCGAGQVLVEDNGSVAVSRRAADEVRAEPPSLWVRVLATTEPVDKDSIARILADTVPPHVRTRIELPG